MTNISNIFKRANKKTVFVVLLILFLIALIYFAWYWYGIMQTIKWGKNVSLDSAFTLKLDERAYYKKEQVQIQFVEITDSRCQPDKICVWAGDLGAQFSATNYKNNNSGKFYLSQTMTPQTSLFDLQIQLMDINKDSGTVKLKIFNQD
ncbi:MAG: hypothetical protein AAB824_01955 [Patescibacteria group bacterium]